MLMVYKPGNKHVIRGVECDVLRVADFSFQSHLDAGWYRSPEEFAVTQPEVEVVKEKKKPGRKPKEAVEDVN